VFRPVVSGHQAAAVPHDHQDRPILQIILQSLAAFVLPPGRLIAKTQITPRDKPENPSELAGFFKPFAKSAERARFFGFRHGARFCEEGMGSVMAVAFANPRGFACQ